MSRLLKSLSFCFRGSAMSEQYSEKLIYSGDYIVIDSNGNRYPCDQDKFKDIYQIVSN
jgi:hypothetical protein